jgi:hypothetical protein
MNEASARLAPSMLTEAVCPECGKKFDIVHHRQAFCCTEDQVAFNNRATKRGQAMVPLAMTWRGARSARDPGVKLAGKAAFAQLAALADRYNAEDREAGRPPAYDTFIRRRAAGQGTMER